MPLVLSRAIRLRPFMAFSSSSARRLSSHSPHPLSSLSARLSSPLFNNPLFAISHGVVHAPKVPVSRLTVRCKVTNNSGYSPLNNSSPNWSDRPPVETAPLFPGCDYEHWLIVMDHPNEGKATKQEMIDCYIQTLAKVLGSEEAAKKSIYNVSCERYFGFGCQIDEETSNKLVGLPGVVFVLPDSYVDAEYKDYGGELLVDGKIVERSPERQRRVTPAPQRNNDRPRYNDRTRYARRRENQNQGR
uniref:MORF/ORRM1/DAG-like MORF domain-containing protein n=1 Tax=Picea sitchensis TaxID=3332 RepID=A9NTP8_PICSI|nr:unknown [Picea sitchensis]ACN40337.1 unknown [Picea sitchensis]